ncbi:MAG: hypothetical protein ACE5LU_20300 [Anaerolineae bacterium]
MKRAGRRRTFTYAAGQPAKIFQAQFDDYPPTPRAGRFHILG